MTGTDVGHSHDKGTMWGMSGLADVDIVASPRGCGEDLVVAGLAEGVGEPLETLVQTVTGCSASRLDVLWMMSALVRCSLHEVDLPRRVVGGCEDRACQ